MLGKITIFSLLFIMLSFSVKCNVIEATSTLPFKKCMNIGNALDAPKGEPWDVTLDNKYFTVIKKAGFDAVRLPVRFSDYAKDSPGYVLDKKFMKKLDGHIKYALKKKLVVILDFHHFLEIMESPEQYKACFLSIWEQLAERYKDYPPELIFEVLNEPQKNLSAELWNEYLEEAVSIIRKHDAQRYIVVGGPHYNSPHVLDELRLPKADNLILTFHYYEPSDFAFQSDPHHAGYEHLSGIKWTGSQAEMEKLMGDFGRVKEFAEQNNLPVFLGEFGVNGRVPEQYRESWIKAVRSEAEKNNFAWSYWEFASNFGVYDVKTKKWDSVLLAALIGTK